MINYKKIIGMSTFALFILLISMLAANATLDIVDPANQSYANHSDITFDYYVNLDNVTDCKLVVDSSIMTTNTSIINSGFNSFTTNLSQGSHSWKILCDTLDSSETSEERSITVDFMAPTIVLFFPLNNTQADTTTVNITFVVLDNFAENILCNIILNNSINQTIIMNNSQPGSAIISGLNNSGYEWKITCRDDANNSKTSETRVFTVNAQPPLVPFNITIPKSTYVIGETALMTMSAPNGTSLRVEVCPDKTGFVACKVPVNAQNVMNYPFQEYLPFTNYAGKYILEATFNYSNRSEVQTLRYEVQNNIVIGVDTDTNQRKNVPVILEAQATGGVGTLNYTWHLSNGSNINRQKANITYSVPGNYTNTITVIDDYNNTVNQSIILSVDNTNVINIIVKDSVTNAALQGATIDIKGETKDTGLNGQATYYLRPGLPRIYVLRENYSAYEQDLNITKDDTITILLEPANKTNPVVSLITPQNNSTISGPENNLIFKAEYRNPLNCSVYINENKTGFFSYLGSMDVSDSSQQIFAVAGLENRTYYWNVECIDSNGNAGQSSTWMFNVGETPPTATALSANSNAYDNWIKEFEQIAATFSNLPKDDQDAADTLGLTSQVESSILIFKNTIRDISALNFRNDLSDTEKQAEAEKLVQKAEDAYQKTPVKIDVLDSTAFVDYIKSDELSALLKEYLEIKTNGTSIDENNALKFLNDLQQEVVISTKLKSAKITYRDGTQSDASIVIREIKTYNLTDNAFILEEIPKEVSQTADNIVSTQEYEVVKNDPIIKFGLTGDTTLTYYFESSISLDSLKKIRTAVFTDPSSIKVEEKLTGFFIKNLKLPTIQGGIFIPIIIILLGGLLFAGARYDGVTHAKHAYYRLQGRRSLHYISVILNEINDNLDSGDIRKALSLYEEAKGAYSELPTMAKNDIYEKVAEAADKVQSYYDTVLNQNNTSEIRGMISSIHGLLSNGQLMAALEEYKKIESTYNQLEDNAKEMLHPTLVEIGNKIQIMIENSQNLI